MKELNLMEFFAEFKEERNIDRPTLSKILEEVLLASLKKEYGTSDNFSIIINPDKNDFEIYRERIVVDDKDFNDPVTQIPLSEAKKIDNDFSVGETVSDRIDIRTFKRRTITFMRNAFQNKIMEYEKNNVYNKYKEKIGEIISGEVYLISKKEILLLDDEGNEIILPRSEQIPTDNFKKGDQVIGVLIKVEMRNGLPIITMSRTSPMFLEKLFEREVPEINDGLITIKKIVRIPGERAKVAVESYDERIDPVGACVGVKGNRIHAIVRELKNENIDVINYTTNPELYIRRALSPAKITDIKIYENEKRAEVYLNPDQVSLAIGKGGFNIRLASMLTGYEIDVYRNITEEDEEDIEIEEFADEIEDWVIEELKKIGCDTAKSVLKYSVEDLSRLTDLEEETIKHVIEVIKKEFEK
ncbi:MAG: transcription termination factor NusA [Bacteroidales bacterium]|nr:transcription termination factor NusA [Bacteroidales bacterium]